MVKLKALQPLRDCLESRLYVHQDVTHIEDFVERELHYCGGHSPPYKKDF
jgi:hypothetical protein